MHIFLTGIDDPVSRRIAIDFLQQGHRIRGTLSDPAGMDEVRASVTSGARGRLDLVGLDPDADEGWTRAVRGTDAVIHTLRPAAGMARRDGAVVSRQITRTRRVLRAARDGGVPRVLLGSSTAAITYAPDPGGRARDGRDWSRQDHPGILPHEQAVIEAELTAWTFAGAEGLALTSLCVGTVPGPETLRDLLWPGAWLAPGVTLDVVSQSDVSAAHLAALMRPGATVGARLALVSGQITVPRLGQIAGRRFAGRQAPDWLMRLRATRDPALDALRPRLGRQAPISGRAAAAALGLRYVPAEDAVREAVDAFVAPRA